MSTVFDCAPSVEDVRNEAYERAAQVVHDLPREAGEWVRESLWNRITSDMAARIRALKSDDASGPSLPDAYTPSPGRVASSVAPAALQDEALTDAAALLDDPGVRRTNLQKVQRTNLSHAAVERLAIMLDHDDKRHETTGSRAASALRALLAERDALWLLIREGADLLSTEADALRAGISINGVMLVTPEDQPTVDAIREIEDWIGRAAEMQGGSK